MLDELPCHATEVIHNRYSIIRKISHNGARRTLLAQDQHNGQLVVIKVLLFSEEFRWEDLKLFEREAETLKHLEHPAIPRYLNYFELNTPELKGFALVQTYIEAKSLQEYIEAGRNFSEHEIIQLGQLLLDILHYLHSRYPAVIHRDIKPSNILLNNTSGNSVGNVYLVDFGAVQTTAKVKGTRTVVGTYGYMPPEQFGGRAFPTSDLYSLGMTLIYLATKKHPSELLDDNLNIQFDKFPVLSIEVLNWLNIMTQPSTDRRFNSTYSALHALNNLSELLSDEYNLFYRNQNSSKLKKPSYSKININQIEDSLKIKLPRNNIRNVTPNIFSSLIVTLYILSLIITFFGAKITEITTFISQIPLFGYACILLVISLASYSILCILVHLFGQTTLLIDKQCLIIATELFGSEIFTGATRKILPRKHIWKLEASAGEYKLVNLEQNIKTKQAPPTIIIWVGATSYDLSKLMHQTLTVDERDWLAQELKDFLDVSLIKE